MKTNVMEEHKIEKDPHLYKTEFKKEEAEEVISWFEARMDRLPQTMQLNSSTSTQDLPRTVRSLISVIRVREDALDVTFSSYLVHLMLIRLRLTEQGME